MSTETAEFASVRDPQSGLTPEEEILLDLEKQAAAAPPSDAAAEEAALLNESIDGKIDIDTVVPAAKYKVRIVEVTAKKSGVREERDPANPSAPPTRKGGNLYFNLKLEVIFGAEVDEAGKVTFCDTDQKGRFIYDMVMLTGKGASRMALLASRLGFYDHEMKCLSGFPTMPPTLAMIKERLLGREVVVETEVEKGRVWNDKRQPDRAKVLFNGYLAGAEEAVAAVEEPSWS